MMVCFSNTLYINSSTAANICNTCKQTNLIINFNKQDLPSWILLRKTVWTEHTIDHLFVNIMATDNISDHKHIIKAIIGVQCLTWAHYVRMFWGSCREFRVLYILLYICILVIFFLHHFSININISLCKMLFWKTNKGSWIICITYKKL